MRLKWLTNSIIVLTLLLGLSACKNEQPLSEVKNETKEKTKDAVVIATVKISNPSDYVREDEAIYFSFYDLGIDPDGQHFLSVSHGESVLNSQQVDKNIDGQLDGLLVVLRLPKGETVELTIKKHEKSQNTEGKKRTHAEVSVKKDGHWVAHSKYSDSHFKEYIGGEFHPMLDVTPPDVYTDHSNWIRYEGPGIESDKVAYLIYLDHRNGFDIFGKLKRTPVLQDVGQDGYQSYHHMQDWGMDILKVGKSLGAGGFGLLHEGTLSLVSDVKQRRVKILEDGTLRSTFSVDYLAWKSAIGQQNLTANFTMQAGSRLAQVRLDLSKPVKTIAAGVVKHKNTELIQGNINITGKAYSYIASWGDQALDGSKLGMAVFFKKENYVQFVEDESNYLVALKPKGRPTEKNPSAAELEYFFAAAWEKESDIATKDAFIEYLKKEAEKLTIRPRISLKTRRTFDRIAFPIKAESALEWSKALADTELTRKTLSYHYDGWDVNRQRSPKFEYDIIGLLPFTYYELYKKTGDKRYAEVLSKVTGSFISDDGQIKRYEKKNFNIDNIPPGRNLIRLYQNTGEEKYKKAADALRRQLAEQPRTSEGAFWHKKKYTSQLWLDGVYMGLPFLAEYTLLFENGEALHEVVKEFELTREYLRDPETGLYFHAWDEKKVQEWADKATGVSPHFWGRGVGWFAMAVVDVLDIIPEEKTELREPLLKIAKELATALVQTQDADSGTWWQIMDKPNVSGNYLESSGTAMFIYFLAKSLDKGYIDEQFRDSVLRGYEGLIREFVLVHENNEISMTNQCYVAGLGFGRDGSYSYYMSEPVWSNDPKGTAPFILAGMAVHDLLKE